MLFQEQNIMREYKSHSEQPKGIEVIFYFKRINIYIDRTSDSVDYYRRKMGNDFSIISNGLL